MTTGWLQMLLLLIIVTHIVEVPAPMHVNKGDARKTANETKEHNDKMHGNIIELEDIPEILQNASTEETNAELEDIAKVLQNVSEAQRNVELEDTLKKLRAQYANATKTIAELERDARKTANETKEHNDEMDVKIFELEDMIKELQANYTEAKKRLRELELDGKKKIEELQKANSNITKLEGELELLRKEFGQAEERYAKSEDKLVDLVAKLIDKKNTNATTTKLTTTAYAPRDCYEIYISGQRSDGVYIVYVGSELPVKVFCDMKTDGGGWTVFQRRKDGSLDFHLNWNDYRTGFGNPTGEFWLGNDNLYLMTSVRRQRLRVDLADWKGKSKYAEFDNFKVESPHEKYKLASLGTYNGTAGDSLKYHLGMKFSTKDQDNDVWSSSCAGEFYKGGWWYNACTRSNLNGHYYTDEDQSNDDGVIWYHFRNSDYYSMKFTEMKMRPFHV